MLDKSSQITITGGQFNHMPIAEERNERDVLLRHCALGALFNSDRRMDPPKCHRKTREAVVEEIMAWIEDSNPEASMMIIHGPAGTGKSALAQSIAERCNMQSLLSATFFFARMVPGQNNGCCLIPTIAYQLISSHPEVLPAVRMRLWREPTLLKKSIHIVMEELLIAPFFSWIFIVLCWITWVFGRAHPRLIVIDGLDECADIEVQSHILRAVATATKDLHRPFRFLITCRPEIHIMQTLHEPSIEYDLLDLGQWNANDDIRLYLSDKFEALKRDHPLAKHGAFPASWPEPEVISKITADASGQFIYAKVVMSYIESPIHSPVDRLKVILGTSPKADVDEPFATLDALYKHIFSSITTGAVLMQQILGLMAISRTADDALGQYTTPAMIAELLSPVSISSVFLILEQLRSVISWDASDEPIKFWHASIPHFLLDQARSNNFFVDIPMVHETLARGYLRLSQSQLPNHFLNSPSFFSFLEHCKRSPLLDRLRNDLVECDLFSAYKAAVGEPITLQKLRDTWQFESEGVQVLFHTLVQHTEGHSIVDVYVDGLYRNYPLEPCIKESLRTFLDSKTSEKIDAALHHTRYVPVLHYLLNGGDTAAMASFAEKSVAGILRALSEASEVAQKPFPLNSSPESSLSPAEETIFLAAFIQACNNCLSILPAHASHYSTELVKLLLEQQKESSPLPEISVVPAMVGPYLEQFEDHIDASSELKMFLSKYRALKPPDNETVEGR